MCRAPDTLTVDTFAGFGSQEVEIQYEGNVVPGYPNDGGAFQLRGFDVLDDDSIPIDFVLDDFSLEHGVEYGEASQVVLASPPSLRRTAMR